LKLARAALLLLVSGMRNRIRRQFQRMRQPKYFFATLAGILYLWSVFGQRLRFTGKPTELPSEALQLVEAVLIVVALLTIASGWLFGAERAELRFSEAEVQFLFPAPATRRALLNYRLLKSAFRTFLSAAIIALFPARSLTGHPLLLMAGAFVALFTLSLHLTGASLTRASLIEAGRFGIRRRLGTLAVVLAAIGAVCWWALQANKPAPPARWSFQTAASWVQTVMDSPPLSWVLLPVRAPVKMALAKDASHFLAALPPALAVGALHYLWVISSNVSFEEASLEAAERRAKALEARRRGRGSRINAAKPRRVPFPLSSSGPPEFALIWKNAVAAARVSMPRLLMLIVALLISFAFALPGLKRLGAIPVVAGTFAVLASALALIGPGALRIDFRLDLGQMDVLRGFPLTGRQVVRAEILGPGLLLSFGQWVLLLSAVAVYAVDPAGALSPGRAAVIALTIALAGPAIVFANLVVQNAGVLVFPAWVSLEPGQARGIEAIGQRLLTLAGGLLLLLVSLAPASLAGGIAVLILWKTLHVFALPVGSAVAAGLIAVQLHLAIGWLGRVFERFDVSAP
jgi:ABC-2 type transport system permease protein